MAYSAVTHPLPVPSRKGGTRSSTLAAQITRVPPHSISTDPAGNTWNLGVIFTGRNSSGLRPSFLVVMLVPFLIILVT
jgi:hypothetical protein